VFFSMGDFGDGARQGDSVTIELPDVEVGNEKTN
jgi:hypothetical protein